MAVPADIAVTVPEAFTVAMLADPEVQMPPAAMLERVITEPAQAVAIPVIAPATGNGFTVTTVVAVALPQLLVTK